MTKELLEQDVSNPIHLVLGVPYKTDLLYGDWFREVEEEHENFHFHEAVSRQQTTDDGKKMYVQRRLLDQRGQFEKLFQDDSTISYICGMKGMETGIYKAFMEIGANDLLSTIPQGLEDEDPSKISGRDDRLSNVRPNEERVRVEVY